MEKKDLGRRLGIYYCLVLVTLASLLNCCSVKANELTQVAITPETLTVLADNTFNVSIICSPGQPIKSFELRITFNPSLIQANSVSEGDIFEGHSTFFNAGTINNTAGTIIDVYNLIIGSENVTAQGSLVTITFTAKALSGTSAITLSNVGVTNETGYVNLNVTSGNVIVQGQSSGGGGDDGGYTPPQNDDEQPPSNENNAPQTPMQPLGPTIVKRGISYTYTTYSYDKDNEFIRLLFDWGDGNFSNWSSFVFANTSVNFSHSWDMNSSFSIRVLAQDEQGLNSSWSAALNITVSASNENESVPIPEIVLPKNISTNSLISFNASGTYDPQGMIISYSWDFGDGILGTGVSPQHAYVSPGVYNVVLTLTDKLGNVYQKTIQITVLSSVTPTSNSPSSFPLLYIVGSVLTAFLICFIILLWRRRSWEQSAAELLQDNLTEPKKLSSRVYMVQKRQKKIVQEPNKQEMDNESISSIERQIDDMK